MYDNKTIPSNEEIKEARFHLWNLGILEWKFDTTQKTIYDFFNNSPHMTVVINCSRRLGKTYLLALMGIEQCIKHPKSIVKFLQPTTKMVRTNLRPIITEIFEDCPYELRPEFKVQDNIYFFANGSEMHLAGTDNGSYDKLLGGNCHLAIIDEAGFCSNLQYIIRQVLIPTTTLVNGRIILSSSTPPDPNHEFIEYMNYAEIRGSLIRKTIWDAERDNRGDVNPRITMPIIDTIIQGYPNGKDDEAFRTQYECKLIFNSKDAVIPEFTEEIQQDTIVRWIRPAFFDKYVGMDIGFEDLTVVLFAYWDFDNAVLVIEKEFVINGPEMTTRNLAANILKIEANLWTNTVTGEFEPPLLRVSDNNLILINDLQREYNLTFLPTDKHNKDAYINQLRNMIQNRQIIIDPGCKTLINHLKMATWDKSHKDFKRSADNGHFDAVMALVYLSRNIDMQRNPYPRGYNISRRGGFSRVFTKNEGLHTLTKTEEAFKRILVNPLKKRPN